MKTPIILLFILLSATFVSCHKKTVLQQTISTNLNQETKQLIIDPQCDITKTGDQYTIDSLKINDNTISVFVNYSGGCKTHVFDLYSNNIFTKSVPPQTSLCLKHIANNDACRAVVSDELKFDISKVTDISNELILRLNNEQTIRYKKLK